jgi:hypothetical protein
MALWTDSSKFFLATRSLKMMHVKVFYYYYFELFILDLGPASNEIGRSLRKIQKIPLKVYTLK